MEWTFSEVSLNIFLGELSLKVWLSIVFKDRSWFGIVYVFYYCNLKCSTLPFIQLTNAEINFSKVTLSSCFKMRALFKPLSMPASRRMESSTYVFRAPPLKTNL